MAWQQSGSKSDWKLLAQNGEKDVRKENTQPRDPARKTEKSVVPVDVNEILKKFKWLYAKTLANGHRK